MARCNSGSLRTEKSADKTSPRLAKVFDALGQLMGICPCCGELFYVSESRPFYDGPKPVSALDRLRAEERRLDDAEEKLDEIETDLRETAARAGMQATKRLLRKIDPVFSGAGYDPQDVKVLFTERIQSSIEQAINRGNVDFRILRVDDRGRVS